MPPSFEELCRRLAGRGTEDAAAVGRRLSNAAKEMEAAKHYDYIVVNQTVEDAVDQLEQIVCAAKHLSLIHILMNTKRSKNTRNFIRIIVCSW